MTYFGLALILGGGTVLLAMWRDFGPGWALPGPRSELASHAARARRALPGARSAHARPAFARAGTRRAPRGATRGVTLATALAARPVARFADGPAERRAAARRKAARRRELETREEPARPPVFHPRAEARRVLHAQRQAQARAEAIRLAEERAAAEALAARQAEERAARTWAGYGYSYGGATPADPSRRRPSPRPRRTAVPVAVPAAVPATDAPAVAPARPAYRGTVYVSAFARAGQADAAAQAIGFRAWPDPRTPISTDPR
jgi:hypothetical protein